MENRPPQTSVVRRCWSRAPRRTHSPHAACRGNPALWEWAAVLWVVCAQKKGPVPPTGRSLARSTACPAALAS